MVFAVILGTGSGSGIAINAKVHSGQHGIAGEWGHNTLNYLEADEYPGPDCYCGQKGCIETFVSGTGFELIGVVREKITNSSHKNNIGEIKLIIEVSKNFYHKISKYHRCFILGQP